MFYVYIIYSKTFDVYYKGFSENISQRLLYHNDNNSRYSFSSPLVSGTRLKFKKSFRLGKTFF